MKRLIVEYLEKLCSLGDKYLVDQLPERLQILWSCRLAEWSARLDERWNTEVWK